MEQYTYEERLRMSNKILEKYKESCPMVYIRTDKNINPKNLKLVVSEKSSIRALLRELKKQFININAKESLILMVKEKDRYIAVKVDSTVLEIYNKYKNNDGFLYFTIAKENCFG